MDGGKTKKCNSNAETGHPYATGVLSLLFPFSPFIWHIPKI